MSSYYNPETMHRRLVKRLIEEGDLERIKTIENLTPSDPYNGYGPLDPIYSAINASKGFMVPYFVEERGLKSTIGLSRALACKDIATAKYLHEKGFCLSAGNHIYSLEVMKLVTSWGYTFGDGAAGYIIHTWNGDDVVERLEYLFSLSPPKTININWFSREEIALFLLKYVDKDMLPQIMSMAIKWGWFDVIDKLRELGLPFGKEELFKVAISDNSDYHEKVGQYMELLGVTIEELLPLMFSNPDTFEENVLHYVKPKHVVDFSVKYNLVLKACEHFDTNILIYLLDNGASITMDHIETYYDREIDCYADRGYDFDLTRSIMQHCPAEMRPQIEDLIQNGL